MRCESLQVFHEQRRMRLPGGMKVHLHTEMQFQTAGGQPHSAARGQIGRLLQFRQAQQITVKAVRSFLLTVRHRELHMIEAADAEVH